MRKHLPVSDAQMCPTEGKAKLSFCLKVFDFVVYFRLIQQWTLAQLLLLLSCVYCLFVTSFSSVSNEYLSHF